MSILAKHIEKAIKILSLLFMYRTHFPIRKKMNVTPYFHPSGHTGIQIQCTYTVQHNDYDDFISTLRHTRNTHSAHFDVILPISMVTFYDINAGTESCPRRLIVYSFNRSLRLSETPVLQIGKKISIGALKAREETECKESDGNMWAHQRFLMVY